MLIFILITTIAASAVGYAVLNPPPSEHFFVMWILGSNGLAQNYYPNGNHLLGPGEPVNWTLGVYNHMNGLEYVVVRVKLLNSSQSGPDDSTGTPSPVVEIFEFSRILVNNETWSIPFIWQILNVTPSGTSLLITGLSINQASLTGSLVSATSGYNLRFVFELWSYDETNGALSFARSSSNPVWTQIWFNVTMAHG